MFEGNSNHQIEENRNPKNDGKKMNKNMWKLHVHRKFLKPHNKISLCETFHCVNDNKDVD
jgi:hypothetical protein